MALIKKQEHQMVVPVFYKFKTMNISIYQAEET
jgi:hypothetical protein